MAKKSENFFLMLQKKVENFFSGEPVRVTDAILADHDALKDLMKVLKDEKAPLEQKKSAFKMFRSLLLSHSEVEEKIVYHVSQHMRDLELKTSEGFVEHDVAKTLLLKIKNPPRGRAAALHWHAQVQVLAELVEHHIEEEERDLIPQLRRKLSTAEQIKLSEKFLKQRRRTQRLRRDKNLGAISA